MSSPTQPDDIVEGDTPVDGPTRPQAADAQKKKEPAELVRHPGKSVFPVSRVQKILKADRDLPTVSKEAVFLISLATEEFIKRLSQASHNAAARRNRTTVTQEDIAGVVERVDEFQFLDDIILPPKKMKSTSRHKPKALQQAEEQPKAAPTMLDHLFVNTKQSGLSEDDSQAVVMNEDGTMSLVDSQPLS
ncbi:hypothetical protein JAAARDRAFT_189555 [Jaapia argillacea MUCL 33604]|uniref:Transcription factor CBF/NF-Y/archaeal histone domain-containing protein n=1 Tax=Jaapia argillacea MUCL 33604 TaxID=933084 RepID=A0A067Q7P0_9AGAM|nr:hypothetical protein JAAARDRAFT_189555 [Jaapia argillacea MUCL 33604]